MEGNPLLIVLFATAGLVLAGMPSQREMGMAGVQSPCAPNTPCGVPSTTSVPCATTTSIPCETTTPLPLAAAAPAAAAPTPVPTPAPTPAPPPPPMPTPPPPPTKEMDVCKIPAPPGSFEPWMTYKYVKAGTQHFNSIEAERMEYFGARTMKILNAHKPIPSSTFFCVKQDNEWKARVKTPISNTLTMEIDTGLPPTKGVPDSDIMQRCLLQDVSLYRTITGPGVPGLRLDYGHCTKPPGTPEKAFIMIGLRMVPDCPKAGCIPSYYMPNLKNFFNDVCGNNTGAEDLDFSKLGHNADGSCFTTSADMQQMTCVTPGCFNKTTAYTWLGMDDGFATLPVSESDWKWLLSVLPAGSSTSTNNPCAPVNRHVRTYGKIVTDRLCINFQNQSCNNKCGKWCQEIISTDQASTVSVARGQCYDCEWFEALYVIIAAPLALYIAYVLVICRNPKKNDDTKVWSLVQYPTHKAPEPGEFMIHPGQATQFGGFMRRNHGWRIMRIGVVSGLSTFLCYVLVNLLDYLVTQLLNIILVDWLKKDGVVQCIRIFTFEYKYDWRHEKQVSGSYPNYDASVWNKYKEEWYTKFLPSTFYPYLTDLNVAVCPHRVWYMIIITWLTLWTLLFYYRQREQGDVQEIIQQKRIMKESEADRSSFTDSLVDTLRMTGGYRT